MTIDRSPANDDRLSAYLDGELSSSERTELESLLENRQDYRDALHALRVLRESLRALPRESLGPDFAPRVSRKIREGPDLDPREGEDQIIPKRVEIRPVPNRRKRTRKMFPMVSLVLATAALILIFLRVTNQDPGPDLAKRAGKDNRLEHGILAEAADTEASNERELAEDEQVVGETPSDAELSNGPLSARSLTQAIPAPANSSQPMLQESPPAEEMRDQAMRVPGTQAPSAEVEGRPEAPLDRELSATSDDTFSESMDASDAADGFGRNRSKEAGASPVPAAMQNVDPPIFEIAVRDQLAWQKMQEELADPQAATGGDPLGDSRILPEATIEAIPLEVTGEPAEIANLMAELNPARGGRTEAKQGAKALENMLPDSFAAKIRGATDGYRSLRFTQMDPRRLVLLTVNTPIVYSGDKPTPEVGASPPGSIIILLRFQPDAAEPKPQN
jgi:negative regulator of sigma E activity